MEHLEGKYEVLEKIAEGGMGSVYKVRHRLLEEVRAIKVLRPEIAERPEFQTRFLAEARAATRLRHRGITQVHDFSVEEKDGTAFIVMEYVEGATVAALLGAGGPPSLPLAIEIALQALDALAYLHEHSFVLRDVAPDNLMVRRGPAGDVEVKLIDLGIAKDLEESTSVTKVGSFMGKVRYASPEHFGGSEGVINAQSDIYSFAVMLYELLTGSYPYEAGTFETNAAAHLFRPPLSFDISDPEGRLPAELRAVILRALEKEPEKRVKTARELALLLKPFAGPSQAIEQELDGLLAEVQSSAASSATQADETGKTQPWLDPQSQPEEAKPRQVTSASTSPGQSEQTSGSAQPLPSQAPDEPVAGGTVIVPHAGLGEGGSEVLPNQVGRFTLHECVAEGRTGKLYKAFDPVRGRLVGLKVVDDTTGEAQQRLLRGAGVWLDLQHPNLLRILHVDLGGPLHPALIATELIEGTDLGRAMKQRRYSLKEKLSIAVQLCDALGYLHTQGVIHREVTPANVLVSPPANKVTLLDSGIARRSNPDVGDLTQVGTILGNLDYMAPEQALGRSDQRSDIFSVGVVLYELLSSQRPSFQEREQMRAHIEEAVEPASLRTLLLKATRTDPEGRYSRAEELADELRALVPERARPTDLSKVVVTLHGIRTHARWQRAFSEVASRSGLECRFDNWNFGYFSVFRFLLPWARQAKVLWFRKTYHEEFGDEARSPLSEKRPSIVAHSFGTYILGNALLRYPYLRFNRVLLCGSILPASFPWSDLIDRGQVQAVRNEYGSHDIWTKLVRHLVAGTGPSGITGFEDEHPRLFQEKFWFAHSEYFERGHMSDKWLPFLKSRLSFKSLQDREVEEPEFRTPWLLYLVYALLGGVLGAGLWRLVT